jgi:hypothetical protein
MTRFTSFVAVVLAVACGDTTNNAPTQLNLDRPVDIAFACYGGLRLTEGMAPDPGQGTTVTAQPLQACDIRSGAHDASTPAPVPPGQEDLTAMGGDRIEGVQYFAFILQSAPGTVALAKWDTKPSSAFAGGDVSMLDADPLTPGENGISVGEDPIAIATDRVGCYEVTANAGSCDMSALDINSALDLGAVPGVKVERMDVKNGNGDVLRAKPIAMVAEPPSGTIGTACPAQPTGLVYVAYPSCHLVAGIDTSTGTIVTGVTYDATGPSLLTGAALAGITCPAECGGGGAMTTGTRPVTLDLELDARTSVARLVIGADNSSSIALVELDSLSFMPQSLSQIALSDPSGQLGITDVALSPVIGMGGNAGVINDDTAIGGDFQFVYAVATDSTIRVADVLMVNKECDTQVDPRFIHDLRNVHQLSCMPVGDPATPPRRAGMRGPGIELIGDAVPTSVDIVKVEPVGGDNRIPGTPTRMIGYFAFATSTSGSTYVINVDNDDFDDYPTAATPLIAPVPLDIAHQLRDALPDRGAIADTCETPAADPDVASGNSQGTRAVAAPTRVFPTGVIAPEKSDSMPNIRQVTCTDATTSKPVSELAFQADPVTVRDVVFPDLRGARSDETWTLTWEGSLSNDKADAAVDGPGVRDAQLFADNAGSMRLVDQTRPYCDAGVEPYDIVQLRGCDPSVGDADCAVGYRCFVHPQSQVAGLGACMLADEADRLANACKPFLTSLRRYTVGKTTSGELQLLPRKYMLRTTPIDGCTSDQQCLDLATYAAQNNSSANPESDNTPADTHAWKCMIDPDRKPELAADGISPMKRCLMTCTADTECTTGRVCGGDGLCMEGVIPPQACVNASQRYELRAGEAFAVLGTRSGFIHPIIADGVGNCVKNPAASPWLIGRLPLRAPACDPMADLRTGRKMDGTFDANPCSTTEVNSELDPNFVPGTCTAASPSTTLVSRPAPAIRFHGRGMTLTLVDPTYPGDAACIGDRAGTLANVPLAFTGYQLTFRLTAGFSPLALQIQPSLPIKVVRGPGQSVWIIDEGDFISTSIAAPSTRGKVYRVESAALGVISLLE